MKKIISVILALMLLVTTNMAAPTNVFAETASSVVSGTCGDNLTWTFEDGVLTIKGIGEMASLRDYSGSWYHSLGWYKEDLGEAITKVVIESGVTSIGDYAFAGLNLTEIQIPDTVVKICRGAFSECKLTSINLPSRLETIEEEAFSKVKMKEINIPASVKNIMPGAFMGGSNSGAILPKICVDENNRNYCSINGSLFSKDRKSLIMYSNHDKGKTYTIPEDVEKIEDYAFYWCGNLTSVVFNNKVLSIGKHAFNTCNNLKTVELPNALTYIGESAFESCDIEKLILPSYVKSIEKRAFAVCDKLKSLQIGKSVSSIDASAFVSCVSLGTIIVEDGNSRYYVEDSVLFDSQEKELVKYPQGKKDTSYTIPEGIVSIGDESFAYGLSSGGGNIFSNTPLTNISIPNSVTRIGSYAFAGQVCLAELVIPRSVTAIGNRAFYRCIMKEIVIPGSVTYIGSNILYDSEVEKIEVAEGIKTINRSAFSNGLSSLSNLKEIYLPLSLTKIEDEAFYNYNSNITVHYAGSQSQWKKIEIGRNNHLNRATMKYNSPVKPKLILSENEVLGITGEEVVLNVYKDIYKTPCDDVFKISISDDSVVTTAMTGGIVVLKLAKSGNSVVTLRSTDGSGAEATCNVTVVDKEENDLLERLALCEIVYSENLVQGKKIGEQSANSGWNMFYMQSGTNKKWGDFYEQYINDYKVLLLPENPQNGFYAAAFESPEGDVIIAHRGSEGNSGFLGVVKFWDGKEVDWWGTNLKMFTGIDLSSQFSQAIEFYGDVEDVASGKNITLTGHSLGGALASYVALNKGVRCDNVNGATGWLFNNEILADPENYLVDFVGLDKYVYENFNGHDSPINNAVTTMANKGVFNYIKYNDSSQYNKKAKDNELKKDYHKISSIIDYNGSAFTNTDIKKEYTMKSGFTNVGNYDYIGTSESEEIDEYAIKSVTMLGTGITGKYLVPASCYALAGGGDDVVSFTSGGDDVLIGNGGDDILCGGPGNDTYVYGKDFGYDTIIDPSGDDKIIFTDLTHSELTYSGALITYGSNEVRIGDKSNRKGNFTVIDKNGNVKYIAFQNRSTYSLRRAADTASTKNIQVYGNATVDIYSSTGELIDTLDKTVLSDGVEYMDYGMVISSPDRIGLILPNDGYIVKVKSDETVSVWTASDADNPTFAKQTYVDNKDLSDGSEIIINTGKMVNEQLDIKVVNGTMEESIYCDAPEILSVTADKTEIKTGESITLSVTEGFEEAVTWECTNGNALISQNDDNTISVTGVIPGEETIRVYLPNDELYSDEISVVITEDPMPDVTVNCQNGIYDGTSAVSGSVFFDVSMVEGYDRVVFDTQSSYSHIDGTNIFEVNGDGKHYVTIYCENSTTGACTKAFTFEFYQDGEPPIISGVENGGVYYTDRVIEVSDAAIETITVNGELCRENEFIISKAGNYTVSATDNAGNITEVSFEIKEIPASADIDVKDFELISTIREEFEGNKYQLPEERRTELEEQISALEDERNNIVVVTAYEGDVIKRMSSETFSAYSPPVEEGYTFVGWYTDSEFSADTRISPDDIRENITVYARYLPCDEVVKISRINAMYMQEYIYYDIEYEYVAQNFTLKVDLVDENNRIIQTKKNDVHEGDIYGGDVIPFSGDIGKYKLVLNFINSDNKQIGKELVVSPNRYCDGFLYTVTDDKAIIVGCDYWDESLIVPEYVDGFKVVAIGDRAFCKITDLSSILIPAAINSISQTAFEDCLKLNRVYYTGTEYEWNKLGVDSASVHDADIKHNITYDNNVIYQITESKAKVIDSVKDYEISIPVSVGNNPVVSIEAEAFKDTYLNKIKIPNSVEHIDSTAFLNCGNLETITYIGTEEEWNEYGIVKENINNANVEFVERDFVEPYIIDFKYDRKNVVYTIGMTYSFVDSQMIFSMYDEEGILENITTKFVPKGTKTIDAEIPLEADDKSHRVKILFWDSLNSLKPLSENINDYIYAKLDRKTSGDFTYVVYMGEAIIVDYTGEDENLQIPAYIGGYPVTGIKEMGSVYGKYITSITLPETLKNIDHWVMCDMGYLAEIEVSEANPYYSSLDGILYNKNKSTIIKSPSMNDDATFKIPGSVREIGEYAFYGNVNLKAIIIPDSVIKICEGVFYGCDNLENIYYCASEDAWNEIEVEPYAGIDYSIISYNYSYDSVNAE